MDSLNARKPKAFMFLNIYDAVYIDCHPSSVDNVREIVQDAVNEVSTSDYWFMLKDFYGRHVPLEYDCELI